MGGAGSGTTGSSGANNATPASGASNGTTGGSGANNATTTGGVSAVTMLPPTCFQCSLSRWSLSACSCSKAQIVYAESMSNVYSGATSCMLLVCSGTIIIWCLCAVSIEALAEVYAVSLTVAPPRRAQKLRWPVWQHFVCPPPKDLYHGE